MQSTDGDKHIAFHDTFALADRNGSDHTVHLGFYVVLHFHGF